MASHLDYFSLGISSAAAVVASWAAHTVNVKVVRKLLEKGKLDQAKAGSWFSAILFRIFTFVFAIFRMGQESKQNHLLSLPQIFLLFVPRRNREHIIGDLEEEYCTSQKRFPRCWYWGQVLALVGCYWWASLKRIVGRDTIRKLIRK
jgi:hypothetical protein